MVIYNKKCIYKRKNRSSAIENYIWLSAEEKYKVICNRNIWLPAKENIWLSVIEKRMVIYNTKQKPKLDTSTSNNYRGVNTCKVC